jgi:hypothetical protein
VHVVAVWEERLADDLVGDVRPVGVGRVDVVDASSTAVRSTSIAAARSRGGPKTPGPASCIAP